ncbi:hypothetical protein TYRP_006968 [Tyrophagus putrescentiae]|nr:hypothetical protein TYRP_006968 [Tyrophagus putrescentiae]
MPAVLLQMMQKMDDANLILWYRGDDISGSPIYTVDGRDLSPSAASSAAGPLGSGQLATRPAVLLIEGATAADSGTYWCRVDFRWTRTLISTVKLNVHGNPPPSVIWQDGAGGRPLDGTFYGLNISSSPPGANKAAAASSAAALEQLAAYYSKSYQLEEKRLLEAWRRWPPPHLSTSTSTSSLSSVIQSTSKSSSPSSPSSPSPPSSPLLIINSMRLNRLERPASAASGGGRLVYHCLVNNSNLAASTWRSVQIDLNLNPSHVTIMPPTGSYLSDGLKTEVNCRAYGGKPYSLISWFLDGRNVTHLSDYDFEVNFTTSSVLKFTPNWRQDGRRLLCVAYNPLILNQESELEQLRMTVEEEEEEEKEGKKRDGNLKSQSTTTTKKKTTKKTIQSPINAAAAVSKLVASDSLLLDIKCKCLPWPLPTPSLRPFAISSPEYFSPSFALFTRIVDSDETSHHHHSSQQSYIHVEEGGNATLDCLIIAKPKVTVVRWTHNLAEIWHETEGITVDGQSLHLVGAKRSAHEGIFRCVAFNSEGRGVSNEIRIIVDCK